MHFRDEVSVVTDRFYFGFLLFYKNPNGIVLGILIYHLFNKWASMLKIYDIAVIFEYKESIFQLLLELKCLALYSQPGQTRYIQELMVFLTREFGKQPVCRWTNYCHLLF